MHKELNLKWCCIKLNIYSEDRYINPENAGLLYKHFLEINLFKLTLIGVTWKTGSYDDSDFHVYGLFRK